MIYEKRTNGEKTALSAALAAKNPTVSVYKAESIIPFVTPIVKKKNIRRRVKAYSKSRRKGGYLSRVVCLLLCFFFVLFTADKYVLDGALKQTLSLETNKLFTYMKDNGSNKASDNSKKITSADVKSSLYNNAVFDISHEENPSAAVLSENGVLNVDTAVSAISEGVYSAQSADGETLLPITTLKLPADSVLPLSNETSYSPDLDYLSSVTPVSLQNLNITQEPLVLILHTHATECYTEYDTSYPQNEETRSDNTSENMVSIGKEISDRLAVFGINSVHCTVLHDKPSFINSYSESAKSVQQYLEKYPSIRFIIDVHRDAIIRNDGESVRLVNTLAQEDYAQLMFVIGTDASGHNHPDWQQNLSLALKLQNRIEDSFPGLCRNINLRKVPFNQQLSPGYLLLEVGTSANTLPQAKNSARAFASALARLILENGCDTAI